MPWSLLGILLAVCAVMCAVGFYKFVYFLSIGYGFAVAGGGIAIFVMYLINPSATPIWLVLIQMALFIAYGVRLSGFLLVREFKNISFKKTDVAKDTLAKNDEKKMPVFVLATIWVCVSVLYVAQVSPMLFRYNNGSTDVILPIIGFAISVFGLILESISDNQKSAQKKVRPDMVATQGLYKIVRCPNYLGEIIFWTGIFVSGISTYATIGQWIVAILAYICIVYIMFNGAQRLEKRQMARYGNDPEYNTYANKTPIIIPLLPIYHLNKVEKK
jgi:steroid 5-alpha reductase family enzyme